MEQFKYYIDNIEISESPIGWEDLTTTIRMDWELKGLFSIIDVSLTFVAGGYRYLLNGFKTYGHCHQHEVRIDQLTDLGQYLTIYNGTLFQKDIEYTEGIEGYSAKVKIEDNSFFAKLYNNRNIGARPYVGRSKNDVQIDIAPYYTVQFFNPANGTYYALQTDDRNNVCWKVYDVFRFMTDFLSDGTIEFISNDFAPGGRYENFVITTGIVYRFAQYALTKDLYEENFKEISLAELIREVDKEFDIGFISGYNGNTPFFRVEGFDTLFPANVISDFDELDKIKCKAASERLFANLITGSENTEDETFLSFPEKIRFVGFNDEQYTILQNCNNDRSLDLRNSWIISSNVIEDLVVNGAGTSTGFTAPVEYDNHFSLLQVIPSYGNYMAAQSNWLGVPPPPYYYNELLNTENKVERHLKGIPNSIAAYLGTGNNGEFMASKSANLTYTKNLVFPSNGVGFATDAALLPCDDETTAPNIDLYNAWDNSAFEFISPAAGVYSFQSGYSSSFTSTMSDAFTFIDVTCYVRLAHYDSFNTLINTYDVSSTQRILIWRPTVNFNLNISRSLNLNAGDFIRPFYQFNYAYVSTNPPSIGSLNVLVDLYKHAYVKCVSSANGGGIYKNFDPARYPIIQSKFESPYKISEFSTLRNNPIGLIGFNVKDGEKYYGWIEELRYKNAKGIGSFSVIGSEII